MEDYIKIALSQNNLLYRAEIMLRRVQEEIHASYDKDKLCAKTLKYSSIDSDLKYICSKLHYILEEDKQANNQPRGNKHEQPNNTSSNREPNCNT